MLLALERLDFINRLSGLNFRDHHHETYAKYHSGTGQWLLGSDVFQGWMRGSKPSTLWCPGDRMYNHPLFSTLH